MAPFDGKYIASYLMAKVVFASSLSIYEVFPNQIKYQHFYLEDQTGLAPFDCKYSFLYIGDFFQKFSYSETYAPSNW